MINLVRGLYYKYKGYADSGITSKAHIDEAFSNALEWCKKYLPTRVELPEDFDFRRFYYVLDNKIMSEMGFDPKNLNGRIKVSLDNIGHTVEREKLFEEDQRKRYAQVGKDKIEIIGGIEVDLESIFVHEISEITICKVMNQPFLLIRHPAHLVAYSFENTNREERGLGYYPLDSQYF